MKSSRCLLNIYVAYIQSSIQKILGVNNIALISGLGDIVLERFLIAKKTADMHLLVIGDKNFAIRNVLDNYNYAYTYENYQKDQNFDYIIINSKNISLINKCLEFYPLKKVILMNSELYFGEKNLALNEIALGIGNLILDKSFYFNENLQIDDFDTDIKRNYLHIIKLFNHFNKAK